MEASIARIMAPGTRESNATPNVLGACRMQIDVAAASQAAFMPVGTK
jgi:hypothetical protein